MKQVTTTQERMFTGDIPRPVNLSMAIAIHILDSNSGMCQDPKEGNLGSSAFLTVYIEYVIIKCNELVISTDQMVGNFFL